MKQQKKPEGDLLRQLIAIILLGYLMFAQIYALLDSGVLIKTEDKSSSAQSGDTTGGGTKWTLELNPAIFEF